MALMTAEVCIWHVWLCGGLYMAFMVVEFNICH